MSKINIIVAASKNMVIGKGNDIPWHIPTDLKSFKKITNNSHVVMGRKCWDSIPEKFRPLPNRVNMVVTRNPNFKAPGAIVVNDLTNLLEKLKENSEIENVFIIGGSEIYDKSFKYADKLYITRILEEIDGDIILTGLNENDWVLDSSSDILTENGHTFVFEEYSKIIK